FVLQKQRRCLDVIFLGRYVQRWQTNAPPGVILKKHSYDLIVTLLANLGGEGLAAAVGEEELDHLGVVLLRRHVQRSEAVL
ncbi:hypothetical protein CAPTEDRAFT_69670, partial [Capitella teleta]